MILPILEKRRSIRKFQAKPVERDKIDILIEAALRSPSSRGRNPWEFVVVTDPARLKMLSRAKTHGAEFLKGAPLAIVICADREKSDVWVEDCSIAAIILQLTAESLGLGSCWAQIRLRQHEDGIPAEEYLRRILDLPARFAVESIIGIGYPGESKPGHPKESLDYGKVHFEGYKGRRK
ncbi:MAG: nitroreductase family protein [Desulfuromonadales bacterium]